MTVLSGSQSSYVYVFDGLPRFLGNGVVQSDHNLIGAFCGTTRTMPVTVEATSGHYALSPFLRIGLNLYPKNIRFI